jgi:hypothetical protein
MNDNTTTLAALGVTRDELAAEMTAEMDYVAAAPRSRAADGRVLVHNFRPGRKGRQIGEGGFRAWLQRPDWMPDHREPRSCSWAPRAGSHYATRNGPVATEATA